LSETSECVDCLVNIVDVLLLLSQRRSSLAIIYLSIIFVVSVSPVRRHQSTRLIHHVIYTAGYGQIGNMRH